MSTQKIRHFSFVRGVICGLASPVEVQRAHRYGAGVRQKGSALDSMRSDWGRIGDDFRTVMARKHGDKIAKAG